MAPPPPSAVPVPAAGSAVDAPAALAVSEAVAPSGAAAVRSGVAALLAAVEAVPSAVAEAADGADSNKAARAYPSCSLFHCPPTEAHQISTTRGDFVEIPYKPNAPAIRSGLSRPRPAPAGGLCPLRAGPLGGQYPSHIGYVLSVCGVLLCPEARGCVFLLVQGPGHLLHWGVLLLCLQPSLPAHPAGAQ